MVSSTQHPASSPEPLGQSHNRNHLCVNNFPQHPRGQVSGKFQRVDFQQDLLMWHHIDFSAILRAMAQPSPTRWSFASALARGRWRERPFLGHPISALEIGVLLISALLIFLRFFFFLLFTNQSLIIPIPSFT